MTDIDRGHVRLAELVAALSLGIDLGFGQPMEHVLRQCLIALRLAERMGLDEQTRANVYYTALLVNVGCHSDAHEQAKWFGDDIALKSGKYDYEMRSVRGMAAGMKLLGSNHPPLHRFRVGLEFALSGHREVDDMISHHAQIARSLGEQLELPVDVLDALGSAYESGMEEAGRASSAARRCPWHRGWRCWPSTSRWHIGSAVWLRRESLPASGRASNSIPRSPR